MRLTVRILAVAALAALAGCSSMANSSCADRQHYESAASIAPLHAAEGLPTANTKNALKIPDATTEAKPRKATDDCLERAPSFYADRPKPAPAK
jgi:uncharacterized lipoprotein